MLICIPAIMPGGILNVHHTACPRWIILQIAGISVPNIPSEADEMMTRMHQQRCFWPTENICLYGSVESATILRPVYAYSLAHKIFAEKIAMPPVSDLGVAAILSQRCRKPVIVSYVTCMKFKYRNNVEVTPTIRKFIIEDTKNKILVASNSYSTIEANVNTTCFQDALNMMDSCIREGLIPCRGEISHCNRCPRIAQCNEIDASGETLIETWIAAWNP